MKPPSTIRVGSDTIWIEACEAGDLEEQLDPELRGEYLPMEQTIRYAVDHPTDQKLRNTVLHEILHHLAAVTGYREQWGHKQEELFVQRLTPWLLGLLRDNPKLVKFLVAH